MKNMNGNGVIQHHDLNGGHNSGLTSASSSLGDSFRETDEMLESENEGLSERVVELEKKVYEQRDEILCLRATLADLLRRVNNIETLSHRAPPQSLSLKENGGRQLRAFPIGSIHHSSSASPDWKKNNNNSPQPSNNYTNGNGHHPQPHLNNKSRRANHHQSTGSLHSADSVSSNGFSPSPTPSPYRSSPPAPIKTQPPTKTPSGRGSRRENVLQNNGSTPSPLANKRWNSTSDFTPTNTQATSLFTQNSAMALRNNATARSLLNLHVKTPHTRHGTKDATYNSEEGTVRVFLRGRPINLYLPTPLVENFSLSRVATAPIQKLRLEWIYGYRGRDCRSNLYSLPTGELVYFMAAVVILYDVEEQTQRHYLGHNDDIKCLAIHPNKLIVATGQCAGHDKREGKAHVRVWNSVSLLTLHVIGIGDFERSISCLSFSKADGGSLLCVIDESSDHIISVWDWQKGEKGIKLAENKCSGDTVVAMEFHPLDKNTIISCGKSHISFWSFESCVLYKKLGVFESRDKPKYVTCLAFSGSGDVLSGDSSGNVLMWARGTNVVAKVVKGVHEGPVFSILVTREGDIVTGGGKDGRILKWDSLMTKAETETIIQEEYGPVRTITEGRGNQLVVGTTKNCILAGSFQLPFQVIVQGHTDEVWGLGSHPDQSQFITGGHDRSLLLWDSLSHSPVWSLDLDEQVQSATFSPDGMVVVVGTLLGHWFAISAETREILSHHTDGSEPIQVVKFSPDGKMLAVGSRDNIIYIYQVTDSYAKYNRIGRCSGHSSFISHLDWSADSTFLQSNSGDYEILFWNASVCRQIPQSSQLRDTEWASASCTLSASTIGIWPENADGTDVNSSDRSRDKKLLATGDDFGRVKLYTYPVTQPKSLCHSYGGHSSHVTSVVFLPDDTRLISIGGRDSAVMQWAIY